MMTTKLEAVNIMLSSIGEEPIDALGDNNPDDAIAAQSFLDEITKEVVSRGWHFNTDHEVELVPDANGRITVPEDVSRIDVDHPHAGTRDIVYRNGLLYDKRKNTYEFAQAVKCTVVRLFDFEGIPETLRRYALIKASRVFVDRILGSEATGRYTREEEFQALVEAQQEQLETGDFNLLTHEETLNRLSPLNLYP